MFPSRISNILPRGRGRWHGRITVRPVVPDEVIMLLCPHHTRESLSLNVAQIVSHGKGAESVVELVRLLLAALNNIIEVFFVEVAVVSPGETESNNWIIN